MLNQQCQLSKKQSEKEIIKLKLNNFQKSLSKYENKSDKQFQEIKKINISFQITSNSFLSLYSNYELIHKGFVFNNTTPFHSYKRINSIEKQEKFQFGECVSPIKKDENKSNILKMNIGKSPCASQYSYGYGSTYACKINKEENKEGDIQKVEERFNLNNFNTKNLIYSKLKNKYSCITPKPSNNKKSVDEREKERECKHIKHIHIQENECNSKNNSNSTIFNFPPQKNVSNQQENSVESKEKTTYLNNDQLEFDKILSTKSERSNRSFNMNERYIAKQVLPNEEENEDNSDYKKKSHTVKKLNQKKQKKRIDDGLEMRKKINLYFKTTQAQSMTNKQRAALILTVNKLTPVNLRLKLCMNIVFIRKFFHEKNILDDLISILYEKREKSLELNSFYMQNEEVSKKVQMQFKPSKTLFTFLNMISSEDEKIFREEVSYSGNILCQMIVILLFNHRLNSNESPSEFCYISYIYEKILKKFNRKSLKDLIFHNLIENIHFTNVSHSHFKTLLEENAFLFDISHERFSLQSKIIKILCYFMNEVNKFSEYKCSDGKYIFILRLFKKEEETLKERLKRLNFLKSMINKSVTL